ncbi:AlpA family phage regulatory protein [Paludibacterium yongneupense]|uniref:AlpA family phage regulatory protein n=1 Tax=Paludibacterium yongneupense TaxID=400061 RepID=UPI00048EA1DD|nr:AlpA family transcriptional regulator [Paludibacterium yongneupense]
MQNQPNNTVRMLRLPDVIGLTGLGRSSIYDLMKQGRFPVQVKLGGKAVAWVSAFFKVVVA